MERFYTSLCVMRVLSRNFRCARVVVALALLLGVNGPLLQYACGATGDVLTKSTFGLIVEDAGTTAAPCGTISEGVHDRLCTEVQSPPVCEGDACRIETAEKQSVFYSEPFPLRIVSTPTSGVLLSKGSATWLLIPTSLQATGTELNPRELYHIPVRLRTLSFLL